LTRANWYFQQFARADWSIQQLMRQLVFSALGARQLVNPTIDAPVDNFNN
jgi:hypothetical protein